MNFNPLMSGGNETSYLLKQTCSFQQQVWLSTYDLLLPPGIKRLILKISIFKSYQVQENSKKQKQPSIGVFIKMYSENMQKFTAEHPCRSAISIKSQSSFIEIAL